MARVVTARVATAGLVVAAGVARVACCLPNLESTKSAKEGKEQNRS